MSNAENSDRRRRVIFMNSDSPLSDSTPTPARTSEPAPRRLRESDLPQSLLSRFRTACGQTSPYLIRVSSSKTGSRSQSVLWDRPSLIIGRAQECDLKLPHAEISRAHVYLQVVDGRLFCADLGSGTGTHWNGAGHRQHGPLEFGEAVSLGPYSLTIEPAPQHGRFDPPAEADTGGRALPEGLFLDFHDGNGQHRRWPATRDVTIVGSSKAAKVSLVHPSVSKCHCAIVRAGGALWVVDLLSESGITVGGELVPATRLESGDEFKIGLFSVAAHYGSPLEGESLGLTPAPAQQPPPALAPTPEPDQPDLEALQKQAIEAAGNGNGQAMSQQFVLDVINQMGVMQQQALQHANQSMAQALQAVTATYQGRIEALEEEYADLKNQLHGLPPTNGEPGRPGLPDYAGQFDPLIPPPPDISDPEYADLPEPEHGSYECDDPVAKEAWVREKMKLVEAEIDKTRKGWGRRLIDLMGY